MAKEHFIVEERDYMSEIQGFKCPQHTRPEYRPWSFDLYYERAISNEVSIIGKVFVKFQKDKRANDQYIYLRMNIKDYRTLAEPEVGPDTILRSLPCMKYGKFELEFLPQARALMIKEEEHHISTLLHKETMRNIYQTLNDEYKEKRHG